LQEISYRRSQTQGTADPAPPVRQCRPPGGARVSA